MGLACPTSGQTITLGFFNGTKLRDKVFKVTPKTARRRNESGTLTLPTKITTTGTAAHRRQPKQDQGTVDRLRHSRDGGGSKLEIVKSHIGSRAGGGICKT